MNAPQIPIKFDDRPIRALRAVTKAVSAVANGENDNGVLCLFAVLSVLEEDPAFGRQHVDLLRAVMDAARALDTGVGQRGDAVRRLLERAQALHARLWGRTR